MEEEFMKLSQEQKSEIKSDLGISNEDFKRLKKKFKKLKNRDDKAFMDMLRAVNRNHYIMNQMVDRKARILLSANVLFLSLIIGNLIIGFEISGWRMLVLSILGLTNFVSIIFSMMAVKPEKTHGTLNEEDIKNKKGNPLFFGNFKNMSEVRYENTMMEMVNDRDFIYRSMIQDIYHLGQVLEHKRKHLRRSLNIFIYGLCLAVLLSMLLRAFLIN